MADVIITPVSESVFNVSVNVVDPDLAALAAAAEASAVSAAASAVEAGEAVTEAQTAASAAEASSVSSDQSAINASISESNSATSAANAENAVAQLEFLAKTEVIPITERVPYSEAHLLKQLSPSGEIISGTNWDLSDFFPVETTTITVIQRINTGGLVGGMFDENKVALGRFTMANLLNIPQEIVLHPDCKFVIFYMKRYDTNTIFYYDVVGGSFRMELKNYNETITRNINDYYLPRPSDGIVNFQVPVNCANADVSSQALNTQDSEDIHYDWGLLLLPENYKTYGYPIKLIIGCHGTGTWINGDSSTGIASSFWLSQGYALLDMNGIPASFTGSTGADNGARHLGAPFALQSYIKGYEYVIKNYNIDKDGCHVYGISMGGLASMMLVQSGSIPVLSQGAFAPVTDHFKQAWCNPWSAGTIQRPAIASYFGFTGTAPTYTTSKPPTQTEIDYYLDNIYKVLGYNPILKNAPMIGVNVETGVYGTVPPNTISDQPTEEADYNPHSKIHPVPLKIWHNLDDTTVKYRYSKYFIDMCKRAGSLTELRTFPSGGHNAWLNGEVVTGIPTISGGTTSIESSMYECLLWFKRFE